MNKITFYKIMEDDLTNWEGDNAFQGLKIMEKYLPKNSALIEGADHDVIYSAGVAALIEGGITEEDVKELSRLNWIVQDDYMQCYV